MLLRAVLRALVFLLGFVVAVVSRPLWEPQTHTRFYFHALKGARECDVKYGFASEARWGGGGQYGHGGDKIACGEVMETPFGATAKCVCDQDVTDAGHP